jgi:hypothetical protein
VERLTRVANTHGLAYGSLRFDAFHAIHMGTTGRDIGRDGIVDLVWRHGRAAGRGREGADPEAGPTQLFRADLVTVLGREAHRGATALWHQDGHNYRLTAPGKKLRAALFTAPRP